MTTFQVGQRVIVLENQCTYDTYNCWQYIERVPNFKMEALPEDGKEYQITFIDEGNFRMVIDNTFIVNKYAFEKPMMGSDPFCWRV